MVHQINHSQTLTAGACTFWRVERELVWRGISVCYTGCRTHKPLAIVFCLAGVFVHNHHQSVTLSHSRLQAFAQTFVILVAYLQLVYHHLDVVVFVSVKLHAARNLLYLFVHADIEVAFLAHILEKLAVVTFSVSHQWGEDKDTLAGICSEYHVYHLLLGIFHHLLAGDVAICCAGTGIQQTEEVVNLSCGTHRRAWVFVCCLLFDAYHGAETSNLVHVGAFQSTEEVSGIGRERLYVASLSFSKYSVEGKR